VALALVITQIFIEDSLVVIMCKLLLSSNLPLYLCPSSPYWQVMSTTLLPPAQWAQLEFGSVELGDRRRTDRLVAMATDLAQNPGGTLPQAFDSWAELKAAYRFLDQPKNGREEISAAHWQRTRAACSGPAEYLLIEDTTELDYTGGVGREDLGTIGDGRGRGLLLHTTLAVKVESWDLEQRPEGVVLGVFGQQCWNRRADPKRKQETRAQLLRRARESQRWAAVLEQTGGPPPGCRWIYIADRESDFYEPIERCQRHGVDFVIRACQEHRLVGQLPYLSQALQAAAVCGQMEVELRSRPGQGARTAKVQVRTAAVIYKGPYRPGVYRPDLPLNVIEVREKDAPEGSEPLHWILLTSLSCKRWVEVQRVIGYYTARWWVEEYHKALKSGAQVEESQLQRAYRLESLIAILAIVALRLLNAKHLARARPDERVDVKAFGKEALDLLAQRFGQPKGGWTQRELIRAMARLGGFIGRRSDGEPGWQTIWRGWHRLMYMVQGAELILAR
jgi:hypothetical protein